MRLNLQPATGNRRLKPKLVPWLAAAGWTLFVAVAIWWLLRGDSGPAVYLFHNGDLAQHTTYEQFGAWFKSDVGLQRAYPWILFGPYVALVAFYFPLERARHRLNWALNLGACIGFVWASHAVSARTSLRGGTVVVVRSRGQTNTMPPQGTNLLKLEVTNSAIAGGGLDRGEGTGLDDSPAAIAGFDRLERLEGASSGGYSNLQSRIRVLADGRLQSGSRVMFPPPPGLPRLGLWSMLLDLLAYCAVVGGAHSVYFYRRFREREHQALLLEANLTQARLNALRAQLQPHFLFNSLNAIAALLRRDPRLAEATLLSLSDLLRLALSQSQRQEISLGEEMNLVNRYLEIQQTRFGDKLRIDQEIDPAALDCLVPALLLQPVIENAIRHGIEPAEHGGLVQLCARRSGGRMILTVEDDGVGLGEGATATASNERRGNGIGLSNLRARLEALYGAEQRLELAPRKEGGAAVRIEIPWVPAPRPEMAGALQPS